MATRYSILPSLSEDRVYFAEDFLARPARDFLAGEGDGVSREVGNSLAVTETDPASLAVDVDTGSCRANGWRFEVHTAKEEVSLDAADPSDDRIDRIVVRVRLGSANRDVVLAAVTGTPAGSPSAPALTRSGDTYEISLAQVLVGAGVTSVNDANITDERGEESLCGWLRAQDSKLLQGKTPEELGAGIVGVESLDHNDLPKTLTADDNGKVFVIDLSGAAGDETITLPAEATAGDGWGVRIFLTELSSGNKLIIEDDGSTAQWEMSVPGQLIRPVTDGTSWFNAQPGAILADTWITSSTTHNYAAGAVVADVDITAGGGGGAGGDSGSSSGGGAGGGAGETRRVRISGMGASETITIGAGGSGGGTAAAGSDGNNSSWGSFATANAGQGAVRSFGEPGSGGTGGSGGHGIKGGNGGSSSPSAGGDGGDSLFGVGGKGGTGGTPGSNGVHGGGGAGGGSNDGGGGAGGGGIAHSVEHA